jgi:hypothetical protein
MAIQVTPTAATAKARIMIQGIRRTRGRDEEAGIATKLIYCFDKGLQPEWARPARDAPL